MVQVSHAPFAVIERLGLPSTIIYSNNKHSSRPGVSPSETVPRASVSDSVMNPSMTATNIICSHQPTRHNGDASAGSDNGRGQG